MSRHTSFKGASKLGAKRSVYSRAERIDILKEKGKWDGKKVLGLPKVKTQQ